MFLHLVGCNAILNRLHDKRTLLFVDESQDYAVTEIALYKQVFPNAAFNLFGDIKLSINPKGLNVNEVKQVVDNHWKTFSINENYRNAHAIPHQMTQNEKYVAYTRALNELYVITMK